MRKNFLNKWFGRYNLYLLFILILTIALSFYDWKIAILGSAIFVVLIIFGVRFKNLDQQMWNRSVETLSLKLDDTAKKLFLSFPFALVLIDKKREVIWSNTHFKTLIDQYEIYGKELSEIININNTPLEELLLMDKFDYAHGDKSYSVYVEKEYNEEVTAIYFIDITQSVLLEKKYEDRRLLIARIEVDNYDEIILDSSNEDKPRIIADVDSLINSFSSGYNGLLKKTDKEKYFFLFESEQLEKMLETNFQILDEIKMITSTSGIPVTMSIGIAVAQRDEKFIELHDLSLSALDIALARGGDQAVIKYQDSLQYYGGKTEATEKRTKVKARVKAQALEDLILNADNILITGHKQPDMDSLGASLGILAACETMKKEAYIVYAKPNYATALLYETVLENGYGEVFIGLSEAQKVINANTLLIIVDVHRESYISYPELLSLVKNKVVIDHHRRADDFIEDAILTYLEVYASSASELVTELLQYFVNKIELKGIIADALLAGIYLDTKDFTFKTGVRTFEAASFLKRQGADTIRCRQLFQNDLDIFIKIAKAVENAIIIKNKIAISFLEEKSEGLNLIAAKAADELLNIRGISASFVLGAQNGNVIISSRSLGTINVQLILEKLGGGGHLTYAGTMLENTSMQDAKDILVNTIYDYLKNEEE